MSEVWWRLGPETLPGPVAVARAISLVEMGVTRPVVSWSSVDRTVMVTGRSGDEPSVNHRRLQEDGVEIVQRRSGGGPVLWDRDLLSLDVAVPVSHRLAGHDVTLAYRWIGEAVAESLRSLGVAADAVPVDVARTRGTEPLRQRARGACFGGLSPFEVVAGDGRKVVGLAQVRRRTGVLFQCGVAMRFPAGALATYLTPGDGDPAPLERALHGVAAGLDEYRDGLAAGDLVAAIEAALARREHIRIESAPAGTLPDSHSSPPHPPRAGA